MRVGVVDAVDYWEGRKYVLEVVERRFYCLGVLCVIVFARLWVCVRVCGCVFKFLRVCGCVRAGVLSCWVALFCGCVLYVFLGMCSFF